MRYLLALALLAASCAASPPPTAPTTTTPATRTSTVPADLVILHARVWTGDPHRAWAEAVALRADRIAAVGSDAEIALLEGPSTRIVDARGDMVVPGFDDAHLHFVESGAMLASVQLRAATTREDFVARIAAYAKTLPAGAWITGGDWDETRWGGTLPDRGWIDAVTPDRPVWVNRLDGHMCLANSAALRAAGVTKTTPDVAGGVIARDASGEPTGIFADNALDLVERVVPPRTPDQSDRALDAAMTYAAERGITSVQSMGTWDDLDTFRRAHAKGSLRTRVYAVVPLDTWARLRDEVAAHGRGDAWLRLGALKGFADGSLGSRTAAMLAPFDDKPSSTGLDVTPPEKLQEMVSAADAAGLQVVVHAIGDRAVRTVLDVFERTAREHGPRDRRFRIEHAQHVAPADVPRFGALGVIASMQPYHAIDDGRWAEKAIGHERAKTSYAWRALLDTHARLAFGSDWHVAPATPTEGIYAAVTRSTLDGAHPGGWIPEQRITVEEALAAYTTGAAYASFEEADKGSLEPGKLADVTVLDRDLTAIAPETIRDAKVVMTIVGGEVVFERK